MGTMTMYRCNDCGFSKGLFLGVGMMYPSVCDEVKEAIANGEYGPELKSAYEACELPAVCPEDTVYECPGCGYWDVYRNASVYEPADIAATRKKQFGIKTAEEWGGIPYAMSQEVENGEYRLVREYAPACPRCGEGMHASGEDIEESDGPTMLKCPHCGSANGTFEMSGCWD